MKICYSNPTLLMKRPVAQVAEKIGKEHDVSILIPRKVFGSRDKSLHYSKVKVKIIDYPACSSPFMSEWPIPGLSFLSKAWRTLRDNDVVHVWVPFYKSSFLLALMKKLFFPSTKLIITMDTIAGYSFSMGIFMDAWFKLFYRTFGKLIFSATDNITLYGESMVPYAEKAGVPMEKVVITPTGIDLKKKRKSKDVRKELGIGKNENVVLFVGLLLPRKGIDNLIQVAEQVNARFVLVGDGPGREKYERMAEERGLQDKVIFTGFRKDVHNFYHAADAFFFPSRGEGLAGVLMEAMVYGVPIVTSAIPCSTDLVEDGKSGFLCSNEDMACYAKKLKKVLGSEKIRNTFVKVAGKRIKEYAWNKRIKKFEEIYVRDNRD